MKTLIVSITSVLLGAQLAFSNPGVDPKKDIQQAISVLLENPSIPLDAPETVAVLSLALNKKGELVVLDVECDNELVEGYVKSRLNYQAVDLGTASYGGSFTIKLRILRDLNTLP